MHKLIQNSDAYVAEAKYIRSTIFTPVPVITVFMSTVATVSLHEAISATNMVNATIHKNRLGEY